MALILRVFLVYAWRLTFRIRHRWLALCLLLPVEAWRHRLKALLVLSNWTKLSIDENWTVIYFVCEFRVSAACDDGWWLECSKSAGTAVQQVCGNSCCLVEVCSRSPTAGWILWCRHQRSGLNADRCLSCWWLSSTLLQALHRLRLHKYVDSVVE